jgi:hypothetical protein
MGCASPFLQNTVAAEDFFGEIHGERGRVAILGHAVFGRVRFR